MINVSSGVDGMKQIKIPLIYFNMQVEADTHYSFMYKTTLKGHVYIGEEAMHVKTEKAIQHGKAIIFYFIKYILHTRKVPKINVIKDLHKV